MNVVKSSGETQLVAIGLGPGELLLESIRKAIQDLNIRNGIVISGAGTLKKCVMHYVTHTNFPPEDKLFTLEKPLELLSVSGIIANKEPHLHVVVSCGESEVFGGHLEDNSEVLYLAEIAIQKCNNLNLERRLDEARKIKMLRAADKES
jgi:predicted DNA-binding protein with PD1-like motif